MSSKNVTQTACLNHYNYNQRSLWKLIIQCFICFLCLGLPSTPSGNVPDLGKERFWPPWYRAGKLPNKVLISDSLLDVSRGFRWLPWRVGWGHCFTVILQVLGMMAEPLTVLVCLVMQRVWQVCFINTNYSSAVMLLRVCSSDRFRMIIMLCSMGRSHTLNTSLLQLICSHGAV